MNRNQIIYRQYFIEQLQHRDYDLERTILAMNKNYANMPDSVRKAHNTVAVAERNAILRELTMMGSDDD